jgi:hypothetical protein
LKIFECFLGSNQSVRAASTLGLGWTIKHAVCLSYTENFSLSLHSHTFSHHIQIHPAVCADLIKSWFGFLEDGRKGYTDSQQSCISNEASTLLSSIQVQISKSPLLRMAVTLNKPPQTGTGFIDTFDSTKITY